MELRTLTPAQLRRAYETDLREAFPPAELKPLSAMERMRERGVYNPMGFFDTDETAAGYLLLWRHPEEPYLLVDYLCVPAGRRNGGIGGAMLRAMRDCFPAGTVFLGESEAPTGDPNADRMILRRLAFYARSGAVTLGYDTALFGVHFKTICWAETLPEEKEILRRHQEIYSSQFSREEYDRYLQIPLKPGEKPRPVSDWVETSLR